MRLISFQPGNGSIYRVGLDRLDDTPSPNTFLYTFGFGEYPLASYTASPQIEPDSFGYFQEKWDSRGVGGAPLDLWVGLLVLRHLFAFPVAWNDLPDYLRREVRSFERDFNDRYDPTKSVPFLQREVGRWSATWREQLQPVIDDIGPITRLSDDDVRAHEQAYLSRALGSRWVVKEP